MDLDVSVFRAVNSTAHGPAIDGVAGFVSEFGSWSIVVVLAAVCVREGLARSRSTVVVVAASALVATLVCFALKTAVSAPRPPDLLKDVQLVFAFNAADIHSRSWPSGHTTLAFALVVPFALMRPRAAPLLVVPFLVGLSRIYVGAHFPSDVLAGAVIGSASGVLSRAAWTRLGPPAPENVVPPPRVEA
jgi:undecaprenyl-diphosphatase